MFGRARLPDRVARLEGTLIACAKLDGADDAWMAVFADRLAVVVGDQVEERWWFEFEGAAWQDESRTLTMPFMDARIEPLRLTLAVGEREGIALAVRERVEHSIVFQERADLDSGLAARGLVRRDGTGGLFTQIAIDANPGEGDEVRLGELEASLRDVVGLDPDV